MPGLKEMLNYRWIVIDKGRVLIEPRLLLEPR
jgi:hypothetical protein